MTTTSVWAGRTGASKRSLRRSLTGWGFVAPATLIVLGLSVFPALWNAMLAARGEGVGSVFTRMLAGRAPEVFEILGVPENEGWQLAACIMFGYPTGRWGVAERAPVEDVTYQDRWGRPLDFEVNGPLYP